MERVMRAFLKSPGRVATIVLALGIGAAGLASPALAMGRAGAMWHGGGGGGAFHGGGNYHGRGGWGPGIGAAVVGGLVGGAIIGAAGYPYYDNGYGYGAGPCWQYQDVYSSAGGYLGRQLVNTCQ
jgi:hypothetical protein